jgi:predicted transcriptional regulator
MVMRPVDKRSGIGHKFGRRSAHMFTVRLPEDLEARLNQAAKELGVSKSKFARDAIANRVPKWEADILREQQTTDENSSFQT